MKSTQTLVKSAWWASVAFSFLFLITSFAFSQDVPKLISYQGMLQQHGVNVNGEQVIRLTLYSDVEGQNIVWRGSYKVDVKDGIFSVLLGSGKYRLPETKEMDKQLYLGIALQGENEMRPLTQLSSSIYSLNVADGAITKEKLSTELFSLLTSAREDGDIQEGNLVGLSHWTDGGNFHSSNDPLLPPDRFLGTKDETDFEIHLNDDHAVGQTPPDPVEDFSRVLRLERGNSISPNIIVGFGSGSNTGNKVSSSVGSSITGGGKANETNTINSDYSHIGGGTKNTINTSSSYSVISGGFSNTVEGTLSSIVGGNRLKLGSRSFGYNGQTSTTDNIDISATTNLSSQVAIFHEVDVIIGNLGSSGRKLKFYEPNASTTYSSANFTSFKAVAQTNDIEYSLPASLGSTGSLLFLDDNVGSMKWTSSGINNQILKLVNGKPEWSAPPAINLQWYKESTATPTILPSATGLGAVSHGENVSASGSYSSIGGGHTNSISTTSNYSSIAGGSNNSVSSVYGAISGGNTNILNANAESSFIGGGESNTVDQHHSVIAGGKSNSSNGIYNTIVGGSTNTITIGDYAFIGGGSTNKSNGNLSAVVAGTQNKVFSGRSSVVGGELNIIGDEFGYEESSETEYSFIGGGKKNLIEMVPITLIIAPVAITDNILQPPINGADIIAGGNENRIHYSRISTISGGYKNLIHGANFASIGGGLNNQAIADFSTIPGGDALIAQSWGQIVMGRYNKAKGTSYKHLDINDILTNHKYDPLLIVGKGWADLQRSNAFEVTNQGASMVFAVNGPLVPSAPTYKGIPRKGATYTDNIIYAWGIINNFLEPPTTIGWQEPWPTGQGIRKVEILYSCPPPDHLNSRYYEVTLNIDDQEGNPISYQEAVVTVNVIDTRNTSTSLERCNHCPYIASVSKIDANNKFTVRIFQMGYNCQNTYLESFQFMVTGRPN